MEWQKLVHREISTNGFLMVLNRSKLVMIYIGTELNKTVYIQI